MLAGALIFTLMLTWRRGPPGRAAARPAALARDIRRADPHRAAAAGRRHRGLHDLARGRDPADPGPSSAPQPGPARAGGAAPGRDRGGPAPASGRATAGRMPGALALSGRGALRLHADAGHPGRAALRGGARAHHLLCSAARPSAGRLQWSARPTGSWQELRLRLQMPRQRGACYRLLPTCRSERAVDLERIQIDISAASPLLNRDRDQWPDPLRVTGRTSLVITWSARYAARATAASAPSAVPLKNAVSRAGEPVPDDRPAPVIGPRAATSVEPWWSAVAGAWGCARRTLARAGCESLYMRGRRRSTMAINAVRNKRSGPGGSTRRLHQIPVRAIPAGWPEGAKQARRAW